MEQEFFLQESISEDADSMPAIPFFSSSITLSLPPISAQGLTISNKSFITAKCLSALLKIPKERDEEDTKLITELTNQFPIFVHLPPFVRQGLARLVRYERRNPNEVVFQIGDHATTLYIILSGMVKVKSRETFGEPTKTTNTLMAGQSFGELALVKDTQRTTTVATTTFTELLAIHKEDYEVLKMTYEKDTDEKIEVLNKIEVFKTWPRSDLSRLANLMLFQKFPPNKVILKQGELPQGIYFIKSGKCKLVKEMLIPKNPPKKFQRDAMFDYSLSLGIPIVPSSPHSNPPSSRKSPHLSPGHASSPKEKLSGRYSTGSTSRRAPLSTRPPSPPEKKLLHITTLIEADYFGEMAILKGEKEEPISVISEGQVEVFHLPRLDFNRFVVGRTLELMKSHAATFPSDDEIKEKYYLQKGWDDYKHQLIEDILGEKERKMRSLNSSWHKLS